MNFIKNLFGKSEGEDESFILTPSQEIQGVKPIIVYAVEVLFSNVEYRNEIYESLLKHGRRHNTRNILVFVYYCSMPWEQRSEREQDIITLEEYLEEQEKKPLIKEVSSEKYSVTEEQAKDRLLKFLSLDSTGVYYFVRDLVDYPGKTDMEWITKIKNRKKEILSLA